MDSSKTGIHFKNEIKENETYNFLEFSNIYTGSGVGIGDFNNDGLPDIFFGGCMQSSRLYLNQGGLKFKDNTEEAGILTDRWITGVAIVDINADGWEDIYLSVSGIGPSEKTKNLLFINNGLGDTSRQISFTESAEDYGIADASQCSHANFFDYDKDGDLDLFLIINPPDFNLKIVNDIRQKKTKGESPSTDKLYRNNTITKNPIQGNNVSFNEKIKKLPLFTDVSKEAGILTEGYSLSMNISDLNDDNWPDIYITNDFLSDDIIYINNQDGTFTNKANQILKHTSYASMGIDIADINNDAKPEIYVLDMLPEDNYRQKTIVAGGNYHRFQNTLKMGYLHQYSRNTLQLNNGDGSFSEVGQLFNVHKTDWSWSALFADYDNDGYKDLFITNGFKRDLGNLDYMMYGNWNPFGSPEMIKKRQLETINKQSSGKLPNYIFQNQSGMGFLKKSVPWGIGEPSQSHGAAYGDLDNDGDLDLITNNIDQEAFIYENRANELNSNHYLKIKLKGANQNLSALGAKIWLYYDNKVQFIEQTTYRGYESTMDPILHFGLGNNSKIDSLKVIFPDGKVIIKKQIKADTLLVLENKGAVPAKEKQKRDEFLFSTANYDYGLHYTHQEDLQVDFNQQSLLPHQHSQLGPAMTKGDVNGDGLEDIYIGGSAGNPAALVLQKDDKTFEIKEWTLGMEHEDTNALFFDADKDGDLDLYVCSGGTQTNNATIFQDRLYMNNGKGNFTKDETALPKINSSTKAIAAADYDKDGDLDLFIGGRITPGKYPNFPESFLLENREGTFHKHTEFPKEIGMVSDALWTDYDMDNDQDLILVGEWMPITIFENDQGQINSSPITIPYSNGWWNTVSEGDFDNDGDLDYLAGNLGLNTDYRASKEEPLRIYSNDFDNNGSVDPIICQYNDGIEYTIAPRDKLIEQIPSIKKRFTTYHKYASTPFKDIFNEKELENTQVLETYILESCYIENLGNRKFNLRPLPNELQIAPINKLLTKKIDNDEHLDVLAIANDYSTEVTIGRYDASTGAVMLGNGKGGFDVKRGSYSGFLVDKNAKNMITLKLGSEEEELILVGNNSDSLQVFKKIQ
ncbi:VCBS repeat-containing protein [Maribacter sp. 2210JD10-5]|uniref:VCBS repeat-containing protein n=1 Tax=Maribacter sp. 2210JD10-5 TaxID=3386272 RepID=UPI0039BD4B2E